MAYLRARATRNIRRMVKLNIKTKPQKHRCWKCKKTSGIIKFYIFPGDDRVRYYHHECMKIMKKKYESRNRKKI